MITAVNEKVAAVILAGGMSARMGGRDKSMLPVRGMPMIQHIVSQLEPYFSNIIIGANETDKYLFLGHRIVPDIEEGRGPLMGIYSCLLASACDLNFITACDIPDINITFIARMIGLSEDVDIVMPVTGADHYEPLHAIYRKSVIPVAADLLGQKKARITDLLVKVKARFIPFEGEEWYYNINHMDDYRRYNDRSI